MSNAGAAEVERPRRSTGQSAIAQEAMAEGARLMGSSTDQLSAALYRLNRATEDLAEVAQELLAAVRPPASPWMTLEEAAEYMRISHATITKLIASEALVSSAVSTVVDSTRPKRIIHRDDADQYLRSRRNDAHLHQHRRGER